MIYWLRYVRWFIQRGKRGWADCDVWNLDHYLAMVISQTVRALKEGSSGYPPGMSNAEWKTELHRIAYGFQAMLDFDDALDEYVKIHGDENGEAMGEFLTEYMEQAKEKMSGIIRYWEFLWD